MALPGLRLEEGLSSKELAAIFRDEGQPLERRRAACLTLGNISDAYGLQVLTEGLSHEDWAIRRICLESIKSHHCVDLCHPAIMKCLTDENEYVRLAACDAIAKLKIPEAHPRISRMVRYAMDVTTRLSALGALGALAEIWSENDFKTVYQIYLNDSESPVGKKAAWALRKHAKLDNWRLIFDAFIEDANAKHRFWACQIFKCFGTAADLDLLKPLITDADAKVRKAAMTLSNVGPSITINHPV